MHAAACVAAVALRPSRRRRQGRRLRRLKYAEEKTKHEKSHRVDNAGADSAHRFDNQIDGHSLRVNNNYDTCGIFVGRLVNVCDGWLMIEDMNDDGRAPLPEADSLDALIDELWPGGFPAGERELWNRLPIGRRRKAVQRLRAVLGLHPPGGASPVYDTMEKAAAAAGTATSTFYPIARRWKEEPSLAALGVHATSSGPGTGMDVEQRDALQGQIRALLLDEQDLSVGAIRTRLGADAPWRPAFATVRRAVQRIRRDLPPREPFGGHIVFDSAGLDVNDPSHRAMRLCAMVDAGTGLILGWDVEPEDEMLASYAIAARRACPQTRRDRNLALRRRRGMSVFDLAHARTSQDGPEFVMRVLPGMLPSTLDAIGRVEGVRILEDKKIGSAIVAAIGERIGPVWIGTGVREPGRSFRTGRVDPMPAFGAGIEEHINGVIDAYNLHRLALLQRDGGANDAADRAAEIGRRVVGLFGLSVSD